MHTNAHTQAKLILPFPDISELLGFAGQEPFCKNTHKMLPQCLEKTETGSFYLRRPRLKTPFPFLSGRARPRTPWNQHSRLCHGHILSHASLSSRWTATQSLSLSLKAMLCSTHSPPGCGCAPGLAPEPDSETQRETTPHKPRRITSMFIAYTDSGYVSVQYNGASSSGFINRQ